METILFYTHLTSLSIAAIGVLYADSLGMRWMRGKIDVVELRHLNRAHLIVSIALLSLVISGGFLFWPMRSYLLFQPLFLLKMAFVLVLILNSFAIDAFMHISRVKSFRTLEKKEKIPLFVSGAVSMICWFGAGITALVIFGF
jgi:hypothetical protein